jgi:hypothetical protein
MLPTRYRQLLKIEFYEITVTIYSQQVEVYQEKQNS